MKQGFFNRVLIITAAALFLAIAASELYITKAVRNSTLNNLKKNLVVQISLISHNISFTSPHPLDRSCVQFKKLTGARVTIIASDGKVLGDSDADSSVMENHANRPEIQAAALSGTGFDIRKSETLGTNLLYAAASVVKDGNRAGFIRLSVPLANIDKMIRTLQFKLISVIGLSLLIAGLILIRQIHHIRNIARQVRDYAASLTAGSLDKRLFLHSSGEFEEIADSLNNMASSLQKEIESLRSETAKLEAALLGISDSVLLLDQYGRVVLANKMFLDMFEAGDNIVGKPFLEIIRNHQLSDMVREAHERRVPSSAEIDIIFPKQISLQATVLPIIQGNKDEDRYQGTLIALHDITQLKKLEAARKDFVANVSHEIKTPITAIQGFAETLLEGGLDDPGYAIKFMETIKANSMRINNLVDDLMTISKIELGVIRVEKTEVVFEDAAEAVLAMLRDKAVKKGLSISVSIPQTMSTIYADRNRLIQILTNLVDNAIKFTETGGVAFGLIDEKGQPVIFVEDTGIGIEEKHLSRLGERFYRVDTARSRSMGGTGLGLAIVKHLVKAHGWDVKIISKPGKGTRVNIYMS